MPAPRSASTGVPRHSPAFLVSLALALTLGVWLPASVAEERATGPWLRLGVSRSGSLGPGEARWFSFQVAEGCAYRVEAGTAGLRLALYDRRRLDLLKSAPRGLFVAAASSPGRRWTRLSNPSDGRLSFNLTWRRYDPAPDDHAGLSADATPLTLGETRTGSIERVADVDMFSVDLPARRAYQFSLEAMTLGERGLRLEILDPSGQRVIDAVDVARDQRRAFAWVSVAGRYLLRVTDLDANPSAAYALTWDVARDDAADHARGALRFPVDGVLEGALESFVDEDWFALPLREGRPCRISYHGVFEAQLVAPDGRCVLARGRYGSLPTFTPTASATYYLRVPPDRPGRYGLRVRVEP